MSPVCNFVFFYVKMKAAQTWEADWFSKGGRHMCRLVNVKTNFNTELEVADIKKEVVENIIEAAGVCSRICQIILFGSVIESSCTEDSDVDMLVISDTPRSKLYKDKGYQEFLRRLHEKATKGIAAYHAQQAVEKNHQI